MKIWLALFEQEAFADHLIDAVTFAEMGFYFEEGGCWGMALALFDHFTQAGENPRLCVTKGTVHAYCEVGGVFYDHQGANSTPEVSHHFYHQNEFVEVALQHGMSVEELQEDRRLAAEVIETAVELSNNVEN